MTSSVCADAVLQSAKRPNSLFSAMFFPAESTVVAVASTADGAVLYDIRNIKRFVLACAAIILIH